LIVAHPCLAPDRVWPTTPTLDRWDEATGENLIERLTAAGDYQVAVETYRAVVKRWPKDKITLRNRARCSSGAGAISRADDRRRHDQVGKRG
jgi:hypothetical protein